MIRCGMFVLKSNDELNGKSVVVFLYNDVLIIGTVENGTNLRERGDE